MSELENRAAELADILHQTAMLYMASNLPIDYGTGEKYTSVEVHMLKYIVDHPGKTVTALSRDWDKTKAAISKMLSRLEEKGLVYWKPAHDGSRKQLYFPTQEGCRLDAAHRDYDSRVFGDTLALLNQRCSEEDILLCFRVLKEYTAARRKKHYNTLQEDDPAQAAE